MRVHGFPSFIKNPVSGLLILIAVFLSQCSKVESIVRGSSSILSIQVPDAIKVGDKFLISVAFKQEGNSSPKTYSPDKVEIKSGEKYAKISEESGKFYLEILDWSDEIKLVAKYKNNSTKEAIIKIDSEIKSLSMTSNLNPVPLNWTAKLTIKATTTKGEIKDITNQVKIQASSQAALWMTSTTLENGEYTPTNADEAHVTATFRGLKSNVVTLNSSELSSYSLSGSSSSVSSSSPLQLKATLVTADGSTQSITEGTWSSSNPGIATVSETGLVTAVSPGTTDIHYKNTQDGTTRTFTVTVPTTSTLVSISVTPASPSITYGQTQQLTATGTYSDSSTVDLTSSVTWSTSDATKVTVNSAGLASTAGIGSANITASLSSITSNTSAVTVSSQATPNNPTITGSSPSSTSVTVSFTSGGGTTASYKVAYDTSGSPNANCSSGSIATGTSSPITLSPLSPLTLYYIHVCAVNSNPSLDVSSGVTTTATTLTSGTLAQPTFSPVAGSYGASQSVTISGPAGATIEYSTNGGTSFSTYSGAISVSSTSTLTARAVQSGWTTSSNATAAYTINGAAATPSFSVATGTYYTNQSVTLTTATSGATIRYTTDGNTPNCTSSSTYSTALSITQPLTLKAIACKSDYLDSSVASATYTLQVANITFSASSGTYAPGQTLSLSTTTSGATIYYTRDGSDPSSSGTRSVYSSSLTILPPQEQIRAMAELTGWTNSGLSSVTIAIAGFTVTPTLGLLTSESGSTQTFTIVLNAQPSSNVVIPLSSSDTTEGTVSPSSLTFTSANWNSAQTVTLTGINDVIVDGNQTYTIQTATLTSSETSDTAYIGLNPDDVSASNTDNDIAGITLSATSGLVTTEVGGTASFTVVLNTQPSSDVSIGISSSSTSEGTVSPSSLTFTSSNWNTPQTVTITGVDDYIDDGNISYSIVTAAASSSDSNYNGINPSDVSVSNTDNDAAGFVVAPTSGLTTTESGGTATFTIRLATQPTANVTISLSSSNTAEGTVSPSSVTFTSVNWNTNQTVTVTGVNDVIVDGNISYSIITGAASSSDSNYSGNNPTDVSVTNTDDDTGPAPTQAPAI